MRWVRSEGVVMRNECDIGIPPVASGWQCWLRRQRHLAARIYRPSGAVNAAASTHAHARTFTLLHTHTNPPPALIFHLDSCVIAETTRAVTQTEREKKKTSSEC